MRIYRCSNCGDCLFKGNLKKGSEITIMCKKRLKREALEASNKTIKWEKCRKMHTFTSED